MPPTEPSASPERAMIASALCAAPVLVAAIVWFDRYAVIAAALGATLAIANLYVITQLVRALLPVDPVEEAKALQQPIRASELIAKQRAAELAGESPADDPLPEDDGPAPNRRATLGWGLLAMTKLFVLFGLIFWTMNTGYLPVLGLLAGYGVMPVGIVLAQIWPQKPR